MEESRVDDSPATPKLTIEDLPNELLSDILKWVPECDLGIAQQVCPLWDAVIDECVGREVLWRPTDIALYGRVGIPGKCSLERISEVGIRKLLVEVSHLESPPNLSPLKFPHLLEALTICGAHPDVFSSLVKDSGNFISALTLQHRALKHIRSEDLKHLAFPNLTKLVVGQGYSDRDFDCKSIPNLHLLLTAHFPLLTHLTIQFPLNPLHDLETLKLLLHFLQTHSGLVKLDLTVMCSQGHRWPSPPLQPTLESIVAEMKDLNCCGSLKVLRINEMFGDSVLFDVLRKILIMSSSLRVLSVWMEQIPNEVLKTVCFRNKSTLEELTINQTQRFWLEPLDLSSLSSLQNLHTLSLQSFQEFTGVNQLPQTLESLDLTGAMKSADLDFILLHLSNLQTLTLFACSATQEDHTVRLDTLQQFVKNRKVKSLRLTGFAVSNAMPRGGISNGDPNKPKMLHSLIPGRGCNFAWRLNKDGYYV